MKYDEYKYRACILLIGCIYLLSSITSPTTGVIRARGRIGSLLEVGTGFHPEMTGLENIYINGSIMGMTRQEISRKLDEIVDFAGVERYLDTPVKRYSSGMTVRLCLAVAAFMEPEIIVVDEVLAVGDAEFQKKAICKMQDVSQGGGRTVLFVSHNMGSVRRLCSKGILLENGRIEFSGNIGDTIQTYLSDEIIQDNFKGIDGNPDILYLSKASITSSDGNIFYNSCRFRSCCCKNHSFIGNRFQFVSPISIPISSRRL